MRQRFLTTYSFWNSFRNCRKACEWRYLRELVPAQREQALSVGTLIHTCLEMWHGGAGLGDVLDFMEFRISVEVEAAGTAAERRTETNLMRLGQGMAAELIELYGWDLQNGIQHSKAPLAIEDLRQAVSSPRLDRQQVASRAGVSCRPQ